MRVENLDFIVELEEQIIEKMKTISAIKKITKGHSILTNSQVEMIVKCENDIEKLENVINRLER